MIRVEVVRAELRAALRQAWRHKAFSGGIVATLALGVALNVVTFAEAGRLLIEPPAHVADPARVARLYATQRFPGFGEQTMGVVSYPQYAALRAAPGPFAAVAASAETSVHIGAPSSSEEVQASLATAGFFPLLGTAPLVGRFFSAAEDAPPAGVPVAVLSEGLWRRRFGADRGIIGRTVAIDGTPYTVIGVAPGGFTGAAVQRVDVWLPLSTGAARLAGDQWATNAGAAWLELAVRVRPGATVAQGGAYATQVLRTMPDRPTWSDPAIRAVLHPIRGVRNVDGTLTREARVAGWLGGVAVLVLLIACANVTNLLLARALQRRRDAAVRIALGGSRGRLIVQACSEGVVLAIVGSGAALVLARWSMGALHALLLPDLPPPAALDDVRAIAATLAVGVALGVGIGLAAALRSFGGDVAHELRGGVARPRASVRAERWLIVGQATLSTLLLVGAGLFLRSARRARAAELGFDPAHVLVVTTESATERSPTALGADAGFERVQRLPGVAAASRSMTVPFSARIAMSVRTPGRDSLPASAGSGPLGNYVSPSYFHVLGIAVREGRAFSADDRRGAPPVAIVNETMARTLWPGQTALGECLIVERTSGCATVVGVVADVREHAIDERAPMQLYLPFAQRPPIVGPGRLLLRLAPGARAGIPALRRALAAIDPSATYVGLQPLDDFVAQERRPWRLGALLFGIFAALALVVASVGTYSVLAHDAAFRRRELGVRLALGARPADVLSLVVRDGMRLAGAGIALGLGAAAVLAPHLTGLLFHTSPHDAAVYAGVAIVLLGATAAASLIPARRAAGIDPAISMRAE
jgi:predicted permease